ncbi:N-acetyl-gamma-glutamyl-phosphate reductase [Rubripirellula amarantea]|uniref:N-acetyl-gamma-glutamyl-phosphate reductase n=1 Tax=Rubripirellula amarantea TaxID=2527999 RepID=A0A5C5WR74_9BACT|nr:N-acetyl-gamma-glutamyl-phosphate reductase [Rubripirellula amarantea]TWT52611.1 N-acetyl-gamma-glutamyl-phosphate reductase [Rubripirellula amarantea]
MNEVKVGIVGATGYTAIEVARLLQSHPSAKLVAATSRADEGKPLAEIHPSLAGRCDVQIETFDALAIAEQCDVVMCCLPHGASAETVRELANAGTRVIDFSADFRLSSVKVYEKWYGVTHPWPEKIGQVVYGMPEFFADKIRDAKIVANPGCYPTSAIMPLSPLIKAGLIETSDIIIDSKSGVSGAGRSAKVATLYCETNESISAYGVGTHRHGPEIDDLVKRISGTAVSTIFTPHLTPMDRGILSTIYVRPRNADGKNKLASAEDCFACWQACYDESQFVTPVEHLPATKHVSGTNYVQMAVRPSGDRLVLICAIDNLAKGASGAAIQNMNVMFGLDESTGLK